MALRWAGRSAVRQAWAARRPAVAAGEAAWQRARWFSETSGESEEEAAKAALREKALAERERYNLEKAEYNRQMTKLRKQYAKEHVDRQNKLRIEREKRVAKKLELEAKRREERAELARKLRSQRTPVEYDPIEAYKLTPEQRAEQRRLAKEDKARRREAVRKKLEQEQVFQEQRRAQHLEYLAREAHSWISIADLESGELEAKVSAKLEEVQPITAAWANDLPKHHYDEAHKFLSDDAVFRPEEIYSKEELSGLGKR